MPSPPPAEEAKSAPSSLGGRLSFLRAHYNRAPAGPGFLGSWYRDRVAERLRYLIPLEASILEIGCGAGDLLARLPHKDLTGVDLSENRLAAARSRLPDAAFYCQTGEELRLDRQFDAIVISDTLNLASDIQALLEHLQPVSHPGTRLIVNYHNHLWRPLFALGERLGLRERAPVNNWLSTHDLDTIAKLSQWEPINLEGAVVVPFPFAGLDRLANRYLACFLQPLCLTYFRLLRSTRAVRSHTPSLSIIIPARNEAGNVAGAIARIPRVAPEQELIFIEGHSTDNTWAEICRAAAEHPELSIVTLQQTGKGKGNAVREAFAVAKGDVLLILDADLTVAPEDVPKFYAALSTGKCEFANGSRLVYPMDRGAMQFLNMLANKAFSIIFSWLLGQPIKDTLCGTKVLFRKDYERIAANRTYFGDFDPFGDFDLLFGAGKLGLKIMDIPVRYHARTYGQTNIHRWKHGWLLLKMAVFATRRMKFLP